MNIISYPICMGRCDAKVFGNRSSFVAGCETILDDSNVGGSQFGVMSTFATWRHMSSNTPRMLQVIRLRNPLQVADMIVQLIGVLVVNLSKVSGIRNERQCDKPMNEYVPNRPTSISQSDRSVAVWVDAPFQSSRRTSTAGFAKRPRANLSAFGNFVQFFVAPNRGPGFSSHALLPNSVLGYVNV